MNALKSKKNTSDEEKTPNLGSAVEPSGRTPLCTPLRTPLAFSPRSGRRPEGKREELEVSEIPIRPDNYSNYFITNEDTRYGAPMDEGEWCKEYSGDIDNHFRTLIKTTKKYFPSKKLNIVTAYKNFKNLCYESSSIEDTQR